MTRQYRELTEWELELGGQFFDVAMGMPSGPLREWAMGLPDHEEASIAIASRAVERFGELSDESVLAQMVMEAGMLPW